MSSLLLSTLINTPWQYSAGVVTLFLTLWLIASTYRQYRRLAHIRGPAIAAWTPFWLFYHTCKGDVYAACERELKRYGSPLRVAPNIVVTNDPESFRQWTAPKSAWSRGHWFEGVKLDPREDNILSMTNDKQHADMRKRLVSGYSGADVPTLERDIDGRVTELKDLIQKSVDNDSQAFDFARVAHYFTLDILTQIGFGKALGFLTHNEDLFHFIENSEQFFPFMELASNHPTIMRLMRSTLFAAFQPKHTDKAGLGAILGHARQIVNERLDNPEEHRDMLNSFIKHGLDRTQLQSETVLLMLGGSDSTATGLRNTVLHLLTSPRVYAKLIAEIDHACADRPVITTSQAQSLPYLRAVVMEGLRVFMPLVGLAGRRSPGAEVEGVYVPEGTQVSLSTYSMLRRQDLFGADADTFGPERWLEGDADWIKRMERNHALIFGAGRTSCLGKNIAIMELRKAVFEILRDFDLVLVNALRPMTIRANGVVAQQNMLVRAYPRHRA